MKRDLFAELQKWRTSSIRKPLIIRGARQVGKSWLVDAFGKEFESFVKINFDEEKRAKDWFREDLNIKQILQTISLHKNQKIIPGKTLLFFDEIQECENAIRLLRYFKEQLPELHVIAAGSLLDFARMSNDSLEVLNLKTNSWEKNSDPKMREMLIKDCVLVSEEKAFEMSTKFRKS